MAAPSSPRLASPEDKELSKMDPPTPPSHNEPSPQSTPAPTQDDAGSLLNLEDISETDLQSSLKVLQCFQTPLHHEQFLKDKRFRSLRKSLAPLATLFLGGISERMTRAIANKNGLRQQRLRHEHRLQDKRTDMARVNRTQLRASRLARLQALTTDAPGVPDGPALALQYCSGKPKPVTALPALVDKDTAEVDVDMFSQNDTSSSTHSQHSTKEPQSQTFLPPSSPTHKVVAKRKSPPSPHVDHSPKRYQQHHHHQLLSTVEPLSPALTTPLVHDPTSILLPRPTLSQPHSNANQQLQPTQPLTTSLASPSTQPQVLDPSSRPDVPPTTPRSSHVDPSLSPLSTALRDTADSMAQEEEGEVLMRSRKCFTCKKRFFTLHHFYSDFCPECAAFYFEKRNAHVDLRGRVALVTGGRVKIGYHVALRLLRCGARVIVTSRFPIDAAERFAAEPDYATWANRLTCYGLDLRHMASVEEFVAAVGRHVERLDILINNACQTVRRPAAYYAHLLAREQTPMAALPDHVRGVLVMPSTAVEPQLEPGLALATAPPVPRPAMLTQLQVHQEDALADPLLFPPGQLDVHGQQIDLRTRNSWTLRLHEVETPELAEVFLVNAMAPFVLASKLKPVMMRCPDADKFIVNVSAMEGKFYRHKSVNHPHTNMAKAALNMMTRTSAEDYKADRIYMTSVDTGWINDENPREVAARIAKENNFQTPLDEIDAAARILDPVFVGLTTGPLYSGLFFKDYRPTEW